MRCWAMRHLTPKDYLDMPWKDGGGVTTQLCIHPEGATVAGGFDWRLSMARVDRGGPFSRFEGHDRHLALLEGEGFELRTPQGLHRMDRPLIPFAFPGEAAVEARLLGGPCRDFNLILRREAWRGDLTLHEGPGPLPEAPLRLLFAVSPARVGAFQLAPGDLLMGDLGAPWPALEGEAPRALLARLWPKA